MSTPEQTPSGWERVQIQDRYDFTTKPSGRRMNAYDQVAFVPMDLIPINQLAFSNYVMKKPDDLTSGTYFEDGDLLVSKITPCFENGKQGIAKDIPNGFGMATTEVIPIKARPGISEVEFLAYVLLEHETRHSIAEKMEGATGRQRVGKTLLQEWEIPFPPKPERQAIVEVLSKLQAAMEVQDKTVRTLKDLKAATMAKLFREGLRGEKLKQTEIGEMPESWDIVPIVKHAKVGNGSTPSRKTSAYWENGSIPWITSTRVHDHYIQNADEFITPLARKECHLPMIRSGSLVIAITGQGKTLGNVAMVKMDTCINQHLAYVQFLNDEVVPEFLLTYLQTRYEEFRQVALGGGSTKGALTCGFLETYPFPVPQREEQSEISRIADDLFSRLRMAENERRFYHSLFSAALHLLMTGKVRTTRLVEE